jgi:hypothetical protein
MRRSEGDTLADPRPAPALSGSPAPVEAKAGSMPPDDGLRFHDEQHVRPSGHRCRRVVQKKRSRRVNVGRGRWRFSTATCCRSARTSRAVSLRLQTNTRSAARTENRNSSMTRPCFITWCRWDQPIAPDPNLLILKHDAVVATHRGEGVSKTAGVSEKMLRNQAASSTFARDLGSAARFHQPHKSPTKIFRQRALRWVYKRVDPGRP